MIRRTYFITKQQEKLLLELKEKTGRSVSETIRRAIDDYLMKTALAEAGIKKEAVADNGER